MAGNVLSGYQGAYITLLLSLTRVNFALQNGRTALRKLFRLATRIHFSTPVRAALLELCSTQGCVAKIIPRSIDTRWNTVAVCIGAALDIRPALEKLTTQAKHKLGHLHLSNAEWIILEDLHATLKV